MTIRATIEVKGGVPITIYGPGGGQPVVFEIGGQRVEMQGVGNGGWARWERERVSVSGREPTARRDIGGVGVTFDNRPMEAVRFRIIRRLLGGKR